MHHLSLDESFWRSAAEALASGGPIDDVEPSLVDVTRLLQRVHDAAARRPTGWLALVSLEAGEAARVAGLVLAALLSRGGRSVLLVDLHFGEETWPRLLGAAEELEGIVDHVAYGVAPPRLVRPTSWGCLSLLPAGTAALNPPAVLRSDKLRTCIEAAGRHHDLICVGLPFDDAHAWGSGGTAGVERAILIGPRGDELAYERAIPRLVPRIEVLATLDVPPPGRWRPALGAALPALLDDLGAPAVAAVSGRAAFAAPGAETGPPPDARASLEHPARQPSEARASPPLPAGGLHPLLTPARESPSPSAAQPGAPSPSGEEEVGPRPFVATRRAEADPELAADVAFLAGATGTPPPSAGPPAAGRGASQAELDLAGAPDRRRSMGELARSWSSAGDGPAAPVAPTPEESRWGATLIGVLLCLALGGGAFWYWRANQQIPEGEFTFVETSGTPGAEAQAARGGAQTPPETGASVQDAAELDASPTGEAPPSPPPDAPSTEEPTIVLPGDAAPAERAPGGDSPAGARMAAAGAREASSEDEPPADATPPEAAELAPPRNGPVLPFSLHVGSYQTFDAARRAASALESGGSPAFVAPVLLDGKGQWYRVFLGALPDGASSRAQLERAVAAGVIAEGTVRETPWALYLGSEPTARAAAEHLSLLARSGVSAYALGDGPVHLYAGAFETAGDAEILNRELRDRGFEAALVRRRAAEAR